MTRQPNLFIAGVQKGGTSTLHLWIQQHPDVFMTARKELHYFCDCPLQNLRAAGSDDEYFAHFGAAPAAARVVGESSPCYLYYGERLATLASRFPEARVVASLRDPVERFWSHWLMNQIYRPSHLDVHGVIDAFEAGNVDRNAVDDLVGVSMYARQLEVALEATGRQRLLVVFLEEMATAPDRAVESLLSFLDLAPAPVDTSRRDKVYVEPRNALGRLTLRNPAVRRLGVAVVPPRLRHYLRTRWLGDSGLKPVMADDERERLRGVLAPDSRRLEELLDRKLPWSWHR